MYIFKRLAFNAVSKLMLDVDPDCLDSSRPLPPLATSFDTASELIALRESTSVSLLWKIKRFLNLGSEKKLREAIKVVHQSINDIIRSKEAKGSEERNSEGDMLSRVLLAGNDPKFARDMVVSFLMAGRDTTSSAMTWLFWLLTWDRDMENDIVNEASTKGNGSTLAFDDLKNMNLLKASLCESMRLYPPVALDSKHAATADVLPDGTRVQAGDRVTYFPHGMGRMEKNWGKDCLEFRPDRWFDEPGKEDPGLRFVSPYKFPVFQAGLRVCLGKEMAFIQMKYVMASVLKRFEFFPVCLDRPVFVPLLTAYMAGGLKVRVQRR